MEIENNKYKMNNKGTVFNNDGDVVNGQKFIYITNNYNVSTEEIYYSLTQKNNYTEFYKKYISNFQELNDFLIDTLFPYPMSKKYDFTSDKLIFGKKIINWIIGKDKFPENEIKKFYQILKDEFELDDNSIIVKRWNANSYYFNGNFKEANNQYSKLYDEVIEKKDIPTWYIDDISVDGRNILLESMEPHKIFDTKYYIRLRSLKHKLSYPDIDREKVEIYEDVQKIVFNNKSKGKYTTYFGIGLENCLSKIQNLIYMVIFYGSITHLKIIRNLIANVMYMYAETFEDKDFYRLTLKMLYLGGDFKKFSLLYEKIMLKHRFVNSDEFINELIESNKSLFEFEIDDHEIFIFKTYGYYLDNKIYEELENKIIEKLRSDNMDNSKKIACLDAIGKNMNRISNVNSLLDFIISCFVNGHSLYYTSFGNIINSINLEILKPLEMKKFDKIIEYSLANKGQINYDVSHCIVDFKKHNPKVKKYDKLIYSQEDKTGLIYEIDNGINNLEVIKRIVNILKKRHEENEKHPGVSTEYMDNYRIGANIFENEKFSDEIKDYFEKEYIPFASSILLSKNETLNEKIKIIKLLVHMLKKDYEHQTKKDIINLIKKCQNVDYKNEYRLSSFQERDIEDLKINITISQVVYGDMILENFLYESLELIISNKQVLEEVLSSILNVETYIDLNEHSINYLFSISIIGFNSDDYEIKNLSIEVFRLLLNTNKKKSILNNIVKDCPNISLREFRGYYQLIKNSDTSMRNDLKEVIGILKNHRNYFIKKISIRDL